MELKELEYIVAIAEEGSISRAAERLYLAQSSLSQFLQKYESELGAKLFMRTKTGVRPTPSGELFVSGARQILLRYHQLKSELGDIENLRGGRIEFGISTFRGTYLLPRVMERFYRQYPQVEVNIHEAHSQRLAEQIAAGRLDMALIVPQEDMPGGECDPVMRDEVCIVARRGHPVMAHVKDAGAPHPYVEMADAAQYPFFLSGGDTMLGGIAGELFAACGVQPRALCANMSAQLCAAMARRGLGLALTYRSCAEPSPQVCYLSIGQARYFLDLVLVYPAGGYKSRATRALAALIGQHMAQPYSDIHAHTV